MTGVTASGTTAGLVIGEALPEATDTLGLMCSSVLAVIKLVQHLALPTSLATGAVRQPKRRLGWINTLSSGGGGGSFIAE